MSHASLRSQSRSAASSKTGRIAGDYDAGADAKMVKSAVAQHESHDHPGTPKTKLKLATGGVAAARMDRPGRKKGGRTPHKHTTNVIIAPQGGGGPPPGGPPMMPPHPPMALPPGPPPGGPPGLPPGAGPGGPPMPPPRPPMGPPVAAGAPGGMPPGMPMRAAGGRVGRARGGKVESIIDDGAGGGEGRLEKIKAYGHKKLGEDIPAVAEGAGEP